MVVSFENKDTIDFDELSARLREEELKIDPGADKMALAARKGKRLTLKCWNCGEKGHVRPDCPQLQKESKEAKFAM